EVVELEGERIRYERVDRLLGGQVDAEANALAANVRCASVDRLHDAGATSAADDELPGAGTFDVPGGEARGEVAGGFVVGSEALEALVVGVGGLRRDAGGAKKDDGVANTSTAEAVLRLEQLREDADGAGLRAAKEVRVLVRLVRDRIRDVFPNRV